MTTTPVGSARLRLPGHDTIPARLSIAYRSRRTRLTRSLLAVIGFWALAPILFFLPPHVPWVLLAFGSGIYFGVKQWRGEYIVETFAGECPRCHATLEIERGTRIRLPYRMDCFSCHHEPFLEIAGSG